MKNWSDIDIIKWKGRGQIIEKYVHNPVTINGFKAQIRLYVLITSVNPLRY